MPLHSVLKAINALIYLILQFYVFYKYKPKNISNDKSKLSLVSWFTIFLSGQTILLVGLLINIATGFKLFADPYRYTIIIETLYLYSVTIALLFFPSLLYGNTVDKNIQRIIQKEKYLHSKLSNDDKFNILNDLINISKVKANHFLIQDCRWLKLPNY